MVIFVTGGSGSGKSEYAENRAAAMQRVRAASPGAGEEAMQNAEAESGRTETVQDPEGEKTEWTQPEQKRPELIYIATMAARDPESRKRIERHRKLRAQKHFTTIECYTHLEELSLKRPGLEKQGIVLLECLSNLTANEMFLPKGRKDSVVPVIKQGILHLAEQSRDIIIVGNNVFEDGVKYDETTEQYLRQMAELHCFLAEQADEVIEVICGIPVFWKGGEHETS